MPLRSKFRLPRVAPYASEGMDRFAARVDAVFVHVEGILRNFEARDAARVAGRDAALVRDDAQSKGQNLWHASAGDEVSWVSTFEPAGPKTDARLEDLRLVPGESISVSADVEATTSAATPRLRVIFLDDAATTLGSADGGIVGVARARSRIANIEIPARTATIRLIGVDGQSIGGRIRRRALNRGPVDLPYQDPPLRSSRETQDDLGDGSLYRRISEAFSDASNRVVNLFRAGTTESASNLFKINSNTLDQVAEGSTYRRLASVFTDLSNRLVNIFRSGATESANNLFKINSNTLDQIAEGSTYRRLASVFTDASNRLIFVFRGGVNEAAANLGKIGVDFEMGADVTANKTSADTASVGGVSSGDVRDQALSPTQNLWRSNAGEEVVWANTFEPAGPRTDTRLEDMLLQEGEVVSGSADVRENGNSAATPRLRMYFLNEAGSSLGSSDGGVQGATFGRSRVEGLVVPVGTATIRLIGVDGQSIGGRIRRRALNRGPRALAYEEPPLRPAREGIDVLGGSLQRGVGQKTLGGASVPLTKFIGAGSALNGDTIIFPAGLDTPATLVPLGGGLTFDSFFGGGKAQTLVVEALNATISSCKLQAEIRTVGTTQTVTITPSGGIATRGASSPFDDRFNWNFTGSVLKATAQGASAMVVYAETSADGVGWTTRSSRTYYNDSLGSSLSVADTLTATVGGTLSSTKFRIRTEMLQGSGSADLTNITFSTATVDRRNATPNGASRVSYLLLSE